MVNPIYDGDSPQKASNADRAERRRRKEDAKDKDFKRLIESKDEQVELSELAEQEQEKTRTAQSPFDLATSSKQKSALAHTQDVRPKSPANTAPMKQTKETFSNLEAMARASAAPPKQQPTKAQENLASQESTKEAVSMQPKEVLAAAPKEQPAPKKTKESPMNPQSTLPMAAALPMQQPMLTEAQGDLSSLGSKQNPQKQAKYSDTGDYTQPQGDLSYVNPQLAGQALTSIKFNIEAEAAGQDPAKALTVQQIVDQILDNLYTLKANGQTETVMTLRHPPVLADAQIVLTGFDHARGEFNIAIHNLTQAAQSFLEQNNLRMGLKQALEEKGYTVHMVLATTEPFQRVVADETEMQRMKRQGDRGNSQDDKNQERRGRG